MPVNNHFSPASAQKSGMILVTTLVIMLLIAILGAGMLFSTRAELATTTNYRQTMKAFNHADAIVQLAIRATDVMASGSLEDVKDHLTYNSALSDYKIEVTDNLGTLNSDSGVNRVSTRNRYLGVGRISSTTPDIIVRDKNDRLVGTVMISHDFSADVESYSGGGVGNSGGIADKGNTGIGGMGLQYYVITVSGKEPVPYGAQSFFVDDEDELELSGPQTFITVLYSVVKSN
ncbi:MAG: hypothetical protein LBT47_04730 [Deltaproteobacteria bacterium]|jgi:type II secretory pathway pseudopilin PulG|nr:hypothetical protein [Deltaproteobacteria bacterium]